MKLDDGAREAGMSKTTVSRVLNQRGYLNAKILVKVQAAMKKLTYRPNVVARQLFKQETKLVREDCGVSADDPADSFHWADRQQKCPSNLFGQL